MMISAVLLIRVLTPAHFAVLTGCIDAEITRGLFPHIYRKYVKVWGGKVRFRKPRVGGFWRESRRSGKSIILPILAGCRVRPARARLIGGDAELLVRMDITFTSEYY